MASENAESGLSSLSLNLPDAIMYPLLAA